ncbi:MAG: LLM class flavin-dependent oxidoreductase [Deltaproteobacteria bacterium]|nr:LLM class flavin-dependent oxidoreductase [Deltaproteobacteria bacterium]
MRAPKTLLGTGKPGRAEPQALYGAALEMARYADEHGVYNITLSEHHGVDDGFLPSPIALMGAMAGATKQARLHVSALLVPLYDPVKLAEDLVVLDHLSQGRTGITAGIGYRPEEFSMFGRAWPGRGKLFDECLEVMLRAWRGERFEWQGRAVHVTPAPYTDPHPVLWMGGQSTTGARRAARLGLPFQPAKNDDEMVQLYYDECERLEVEEPLVIPPGTGEMFWISEDPDRSWAEIGPHLLHEATCYRSWQREGQESIVTSEALTVEALRAEGLYKILTPDEAVARAEADGPAAAFPLYPLCGGTPPDLAWRSLELFVGKVLPRISSLA